MLFAFGMKWGVDCGEWGGFEQKETKVTKRRRRAVMVSRPTRTYADVLTNVRAPCWYV